MSTTDTGANTAGMHPALAASIDMALNSGVILKRARYIAALRSHLYFEGFVSCDCLQRMAVLRELQRDIDPDHSIWNQHAPAQTRALAHYAPMAHKAIQERPFTWSGLPRLMRSPTYRDSWTVEELRAVITAVMCLISEAGLVDAELCIEHLADAADATDLMSEPSDVERAEDAADRAAESRESHRKEMAGS